MPRNTSSPFRIDFLIDHAVNTKIVRTKQLEPPAYIRDKICIQGPACIQGFTI